MMMVDLCDTLIVTVKPHENPIRLVLLDTGITSSLSDTDLQNFKDVFTAVIIGEVRHGKTKQSLAICTVHLLYTLNLSSCIEKEYSHLEISKLSIP